MRTQRKHGGVQVFFCPSPKLAIGDRQWKVTGGTRRGTRLVVGPKPPHNLGAARRVAVLDLVGPPEALGVVWAESSQQIVCDGWFQQPL